jgi:serine/threonine protein kinase/tetratricopeptide (TPR) repeat protein
MTDASQARREQIKGLFMAVQAAEPAERATLLDRVGAVDPDLRMEVEQLLGDYPSAEKFFADFFANLFDRPAREGDPPKRISAGALLAGRFRILKFLGEGGMAQVYEAEDLVLRQEHVALKTLPAVIADDERAIEGLKHEIAIGRRVTHPNVCRVFDVYRHEAPPSGSITFFTMELLDGETLAARLRERGRMSTAQALPVVKQMAAGLGAAHAARIVHGDFKPGNVMLVPGQDGTERVVVTDFGLAHRAPTGSMPDPPTAGNQGWGTPAYMAPEQIQRRRITCAADIYALGVVVHEMITGTLPSEVHSQSLSVEEHIPKMDPRWDAAIGRCLERDPDARFTSPDEFIEALAPSTTRWRWLVGLAGLVVLLLLLVLINTTLTSRSPSELGVFGKGERSLALIPFTETSPTPDSVAFSQGLVAVLTEQLRLASEIEHFERRLWVVPAGEVIDAGLKTPAGAHRTLGITLILTGRLDRGKDGTRITLNLVEASPQGTTPKESETLEVQTGSQLFLPTTLNRLAQMLGKTLPAATLQAVAAGSSGLPAAEEYFLRGRGYLAGRRSADLDVAIDAFQRAIQLDKAYALAHASLGEAYRRKYRVTLDRSFIPRAQASCDEALALNPSIAYTRVIRGLVYQTTGQYERAINELQAALQADPGAVDARRGLAEAYEAEGALKTAEDIYRQQIAQYSQYWSAYEEFGSFLFRHGRYREAEASFVNGLRYAPDNLRAISNLAGIYILTERFAAAEAELQKGLNIGPDVLLYNNLSWVYIFQGRFSDAVAPMEQAVRLPGADSFHWGNLARVYRWAGRQLQAKSTYETAIRLAREEIHVNPRNAQIRANLAYLWAETGNRGEALAEIASTLERAPTDMTVLFKSALVQELTGDRSGALQSLEAAARGGHSMVEIRRHPDLGSLRDDPRYLRILTIAKEDAARKSNPDMRVPQR